MEPTKQQGNKTEQAEPHVGGEQQEPGAPTRQLNDETTEGASDVEEIARQQGASQRGYTADGPHEDRPAQFDPAHPGGRPEGDPRR
ncbi:uncharacterized protein SOCE26_016830 [Sorangium cellulosum]|uniref:Uncharacterized protein n=1 Tax=Sorangium cellulosum TaxID=56 RepID=A0A2L0ELV6_SORCE|nr:hypothetical protein [Sorangium cellulosum]AUX40283.1 uncharacterized protein SOCE26_016830 [Sorangium cellulosum]